MSRDENDLCAQFPIQTEALANLPDETIVDGAIVALDEKGTTFIDASIPGSLEDW